MNKKLRAAQKKHRRKAKRFKARRKAMIAAAKSSAQ